MSAVMKRPGPRGSVPGLPLRALVLIAATRFHLNHRHRFNPREASGAVGGAPPTYPHPSRLPLVNPRNLLSSQTFLVCANAHN
jgi:hypothetical protein